MQKPKVIICDIDGTLALLQGRNPFETEGAEDDLLNYPVSNILEVYSSQTVYPVSLILISGREERFRVPTEKWLNKHNIIHYESLYLRKNNDFRKDYVIKKEIYERYIEDVYEVLFVLEDRDQVVNMWRSIGLPCLQVAYGDF